jgi:sugar phosphate isomerase/epimerase
MILGISSYTLTWSIGVPGYDRPAQPLTAVGLIHKAVDQGLRLVQIADNIPLHQLSLEELEHIRQTADDAGISIEIGTRGTDPQHLLKYLELAELFNAKLFRTLITTAEIAQAEQDLMKVLPDFAEAGVTIGVENHGLHTTAQLTALFNNINSPYVGCVLDTVNSFSALESPDQVINALTPYIVNLHIKDFEIQRIKYQMGFEVLGTPAGCGRLDIPKLVETMNQHGKAPTAILELWTPYTNSVEETVQLENEWFDQSLVFLKQHFPNELP